MQFLVCTFSACNCGKKYKGSHKQQEAQNSNPKYWSCIAGIRIKKCFSRRKDIGDRQLLVYISCKNIVASFFKESAVQRFLPAVCSNVIARKGVTDIKSLQIAGEFFGFRLNQYIGNFFPGIQNLVQILVVINCGADAFGSCGILGFSRIDIF